jgi:RNA polymerase sigma-70 factor (ECF subfamily)
MEGGRNHWDTFIQADMNPTEIFEALVKEHYEALFRFAMTLTRERTDAGDLTQQTFYIWATRGHQLRDRSKVRSWLFTTLHRQFLNTQRRQVRFPHSGLEEVEGQLPADQPRFEDRVDSSSALSALGRIDEIYRAAVSLFYLEDCSYPEIAAILEVPIGTVKSRLVRGIKQLRDVLLSRDPSESGLSIFRSEARCRSQWDIRPSPFQEQVVRW